MNNAQIIDVLKGFCVEITIEQADKLLGLVDLTLKKNEVMNLTAIKDRDEFVVKMIIDSALSFNNVDLANSKTCIDVGTGGGFPGLVLAILYPSIQFTLLDATKKKCDHVIECANELGLNNVNVINARAEEYARNNRESFDIVVSRAVSCMNVLLELCIPLLKVKGCFVALKGKIGEDELNNSSRALKTLNCSIINRFVYTLPNESGERINFHISKDKNTNNIYPRDYRIIKKKPL